MCSVAGTHFLPYVKFFGPKGLNIPFAVVTDTDPIEGKEALGVGRLRRLLEYLCPKEAQKANDNEAFVELGKQNGVFLTPHTLEVALFRSGRRVTFYGTMQELSTNEAAKKRAEGWKDTPEDLDPEQMLKDIGAIGKGRFAQRWAYHISQQDTKLCPESVKAALAHVISQIT